MDKRRECAEGNSYRVLSLPYGDKTEEMEMLIVLPSARSALTASEFLETFSLQEFQKIQRQMKVSQGTVRLPRFKIEYKKELVKTLKALELKLAFSSAADFSRLSATATNISEVLHKTKLEVDEKGARMAAITSVGLRTTSIDLTPSFGEFNVDRPFMLYVVDKQTGATLFMGWVANPEPL